jgi:DNA-binding NtrC family response regulator
MTRTVVIAEADPTVRRLIRHGLAHAGVSVAISAADTASLVRLAADRVRCGAVIAGHPLDAVDGAALVAAVRLVAPAVPVFLFCGDTLNSTDISNARDIEIYMKPHGLLEMCRAVAEALEIGCRVLVAG